jgi:DoxX-like family
MNTTNPAGSGISCTRFFRLLPFQSVQHGLSFPMTCITFSLTMFSGVSFVAYGISCLFSSRMRVEFERFGLARFRTMVGGLELLGGCAQLVSWFFSPLGILAAGGLSALMLLGVVTRIRIGDGLLVSMPAIGYMLLNAHLLLVLIKL